MEILKRDKADLIKMVITIGIHWRPLELEIAKRDNAELIQVEMTIGAHWSWRLIRETMPS